MANPRKFSEKIALHHQKQAEETAAFEQIMREVSDATNRVKGSRGGGGGGGTRGLAPALGPLRAGSLPDVSSVPPVTPSQQPKEKPEANQVAQFGLPYNTGNTGPGQQINKGNDMSRSPITVPTPAMPQQQRGRPAGVGPMRARPQERKIDTSPYGSTVYLSPPDGGWRRTISDSALHQSSVAPRDVSPQGGSPHHHHNMNHHHHQNIAGSHHHHHYIGGQLQQHHHSHSHQGLNTASLHHTNMHSRRDGTLDGMLSIVDVNPNRPRSSCEVPRVPGIHIYPSSHDSNGAQIPVSSNTGSLPDLTSVHFPPPPLHSGHIDKEILDQNSSPYSTSPVSTSPITLSPTSVPPIRSGHSPHHSPRSTPHTGSPTAPQYTNHRTPQGANIDSSWMQANYQQQCSPPSLHSSHSNINLPSPTMGVAPSQLGGVSNGGGYRSPRSPGSSPGGGGGGGDSPHYDAGGNSSSSYSTQTTSENYYINEALQHNFEQFSMDWAQLVQSLVESGVTWTAQVQLDTPTRSINYIGSVSSGHVPYDSASGDGGGSNLDWSSGRGTCSEAIACVAAGRCLGVPPCLPHAQPTTPTTIPDIVLTDFSNTNPTGDLGKELSTSLSNQMKEFSNIGGHFETSLFPEDESLRDGLDPIDFEGFQMLSDPEINVISDPTTEDAFRLDRL